MGRDHFYRRGGTFFNAQHGPELSPLLVTVNEDGQEWLGLNYYFDRTPSPHCPDNQSHHHEAKQTKGPDKPGIER
jgi:hypothetical protein